MPLDSFVVPEGLEIVPWAVSPLLYNPTNMDVDQSGRIWVTEGVNYRSNQDRRPEGDRIVILEDTDMDGKARPQPRPLPALRHRQPGREMGFQPGQHRGDVHR